MLAGDDDVLADAARFAALVLRPRPVAPAGPPYGDGKAAQRVTDALSAS